MIFILRMILFVFALNHVWADEVIPYDWSKVLEIPPGAHLQEGSQILHFKSQDNHYTNNPRSIEFVEKYLSKAKKLQSDAQVIKAGSEAVTLKGMFLEMGVCTGKTINFIAALNSREKIYGFDSFEGLPEEWIRKDAFFKKGTFAYKKNVSIPPVLHNVYLYKGWFKDTLPKFKEEILGTKPIAFLHIDCGLYSSTKDVFNNLKDNIIPGTIIVFDEFYNYPGSDLHEWKAFNEFLEEKQLGIEYLAYNENHEQVAVKIIQK